MNFPYVRLPTGKPVYPLGGASVRYRPIIPVTITGPTGSRHRDGSIDSGSDDTLLPGRLAVVLGIPLTRPPDEGEGRPIGGPPIRYPYGRVMLRISNGVEAYEWDAIVGFPDLPLRWAILGHAGFLQYFDVQLLGAHHELVLAPNPTFPGHITRRPPPP